MLARFHGLILRMLMFNLLAGLAVTAIAQSGVPRPDHVVIVVEENHAFGDIIKSSGPSYINRLAREGALLAASYGVSHPSEPNYLALFSGSTHGVTSDICSGAYGTPNLGSELLEAGLTFVGYSESLPYTGFTGCESGHYKRKHNPWVNFTNVPPSLNQSLTKFPTNFADLPTLCFVVPNQANDMHSGSIGQADAWLRRHLDAYKQWAQTNNSLLVVTWDEDDKSSGNHIPTIFVGPMVRPGKYCERINHYNVLRTLLEMYGLAPMVHATNADPITSCWMPGSAPSAVTLDLTSPGDGDAFLAGSNILFSADAASSNGVVKQVEFFNGSRKLGAATNSPFTFVWSNAPSGTSCLFAKATDSAGRTKTSVSIQVRVLPPDSTPPSVTILAPSPNARESNAVVTLHATATDNVGVAAMAYRVGNAPFQTIEGTNEFSTMVPLAPGTNTIQVKSIDYYGHESAVASANVFYVTTSTLTLSVTGNGAVLPDLDGRTLEVGRGYTVNAQPAAGNLFASWNGGVTSLSSRLTFLMQSNLMLGATFVTNPFIAVRGAYAGLFYEPAEVRHESSGFLAMALTEQGRFSAQILSAGRRLSFSGAFDLQGRATNVVQRRGTNALTVELALDLAGAGQQVTGRVSTVQWNSALLGDRNVFDGRTLRAPFATNYTLVVNGDPELELHPGGDGFGTARVNAAGVVSFAGTLADGTKVTQKTGVSTNGSWPFYASLYAGKGSVLSWLTFADRLTADLGGRLNWIKPARPADRLYPEGFAFATDVEGSVYTRPGAARALLLTNGIVAFTGGNLGETFTNSVVLDPNNKVTNQSSNRLTLVIVPASGLFSGAVTPPDGGRSLSFKGALLQRQTAGRGFFIGTNHTGRVTLTAPGS
jgi:acid phosphatase